MKRELSIQAFKTASQYIPGGVNSPVRALRSVGETPLFIQRANKSKVTDIDGNEFIDFCQSWGVFILGHSHPQVKKAVKKAVGNGTSYGIPTVQETTLAQLVNRFFPSMEKVRFVSSGTEAVMSAIRLARGYTGRNIIIKFDGCYHGHADHLLVSAGSGVANLNASSSSGVPVDFTKYTISIPYNDEAAVRAVFEKEGDGIAAVIIEPVAANMGIVLPNDGFLSFLRDITHRYGSLLIFDEVITGFRVSLGGAQGRFGVAPDLTTLGKIVGGGFPAAAFGGRNDIMALLAPEGPVYQAGTLSGNPIAMTAGIETIKLLSEPSFYEDLEKKSNDFIEELQFVISGKEMQLNHIGSLFTLFFNPNEVHSFEDAKQSDQERFARFFRKLLARNIYISPSQFEANFISAAHSRKDLDYFLKAVKKSL
ncbi:glutamate-1-semialdehyde 2,1-aminomutase [Parabacteroides sp. Marseille-P3160]|uniref:glutamate-1-semialdehyde 2,1-aminomutase n=1 Tax=Parabacteroides sp. Marseille-P3160 TaxID=1917887 RepID=UPI0009BC4D56|nr:glutamate-1-semialdehyde 2,1-aminomutase [Parabacteroides sp. Marseille-P3160]